MENKLNIEEVKYLIPDYITGKIDANDKFIVENTIKESEEINAFYKEMKATFEFAGNIKFEQPPQQYWNNLLPRIHQRIETEKERKASRNPLSILWKILVPVAAVVLIFIIYQLAFSPEKQIVNENKFIEQKEFKNNNIEPKDKIENKVEDKKENKVAQDNKSQKYENNSEKTRTTRRYANTPIIKDYNEQNIANKTDNSDDNLIKENLINKDKEELASVDIDESSITITGQAAGFDEEIESDLNKLNDNEQKNLLEQLSSSNL